MRYLLKMEIRDIINANLALAVHRCGNISALASKCEKGSIKYFEQILSGFQGPKDKHPRSAGASVAAAVAKAIGEPAQWMYEQHEEEWRLNNIEYPGKSTMELCEPTVPAYHPPPSRRQIEINQIVDMLYRTDDRGLAIMLDKAKDISLEYPFIKQTLQSST